MKNKRILFFVMILGILLSNCSKIMDSTNEPSIETPIDPTSTEDLTTLVATTNTVDSTPTNMNSISTIPICPKSGVQIEPPADFGIPGTIVYQEGFQGLNTVGGDPLTYSKLSESEEQKYSVFGFSPNGKWFAFSPIEYSPSNEIIFESPKIVLLSADGERIEKRFSLEDFKDELPAEFHFMGFSGYSHWINNTTIYAALYSSTMTSTSAGSIDDLPKVLDPFRGVWREDLLKDLPEATISSAKGISPDLARMLYMDADGLSLKDLAKGIDIWHDKSLFAEISTLMFWSPDSKTVAYANRFDSTENRTVILISRNGVAKPIMGSTSSLTGLLVEDLSWSPDGHYLAILAWDGEGKGDSVFIYDFDAVKYITQCPIASSEDMSPKIFWSPDNKYLAYAALDYPLIIMDVQSGEIIKLADQAKAVGWSDKFPVVWP